MARPTKGVVIRRINLLECRFGWTVSGRTPVPEGKAATRERSLSFSTSRHVASSVRDNVQLTVTVRVVGHLGGVPTWEMSVTYFGEFVLAEDAEVTLQLLTDVHGPAYVYAFCRECVADLARRSKVADDLFLPPFNFQADPGEALES